MPTFIDSIKATLRSLDPADVASVKAANEALLRCKALSGTVHSDTTLSNLSIQYRNDEYIGTRLMPIVSVSKLSDKIAIYGKRDRLSGPDDSVGSRSTPNEINETRSTTTFSCEPRALIDFVDALTLANQDAPFNEMVDLVQSINDVLDLKEEQRIATILTTGSNFGANTAAVAAADRWNKATSHPIDVVNAAVDATWSGYGASRLVGYCGLEVFRVLQRHPEVIDLYKYNGGTASQLSASALAATLGLDELLVGRARNDTANIGQTAVYARIWGKQFGVVRVASNPSVRSCSFGYTLRFEGKRATTQWFDQKPGTRGGYYAKVAMEEVQKIVAADAGYLLTTVID